MNKVLAAAATTAILCSAGMANVLWDNGGIVTHPGAGSGGFDVSMASVGASAGANARQTTTAGEEYYRIADDFDVSGNWTVESVTVHAYETNENVPGWTGGDLNIWDGSPDDANSSIVASFSDPAIAQTNIYRVFNGSANLSNTARLVNTVTFDLSDLALADGTYWIDWQVEGGASGWAPPVMEANAADPNDPTTPAGNALQLTPDGWEAFGDDNDTPFIVSGVPAPGAAATLALAGLVGLRRRR